MVARIIGFVGFVSGLTGSVTAMYAVLIILFSLFGYKTVHFRGMDMDADWPTAAALGGIAAVLLGFSSLLHWIIRGRDRPGMHAPS